MDGPRIKQLWHCNPTPSNHKIMKIIAKNFFYAHKLTILRQSAWKLVQWKFNALKSPKLWKLCVQNVCCNKGYSRNKCLSIVMNLTGWSFSELFILLSINPKCNIIIFSDCPEIRGSKPGQVKFVCPFSFHLWNFHIRNNLSSNNILDLYREF